jgi:hypothetical protein
MYDALEEVLGEKIPYRRKKSGKYTGVNSPNMFGKKSAEYFCAGAHSLSDQHSVKSCPTHPPFYIWK